MLLTDCLDLRPIYLLLQSNQTVHHFAFQKPAVRTFCKYLKKIHEDISKNILEMHCFLTQNYLKSNI